MKRAKLLWIDLEMTGLDPAKCRILEVAAIATDWNFQELATYQSVIHQPNRVLRKADEWVQENMAELLDKSRESERSEARVTEELLDFIRKNFGEKADVVLAGNSIHQDRRFIRRYWPEIDSRLHYRMLDVSSYKLVAQGLKKREFKKESAHRALEDIRDSIAELQYYLKH